MGQPRPIPGGFDSNFNPVPTVLESIAWLAYLVPVLILYFRPVRASTPPAVPAKAAEEAI